MYNLSTIFFCIRSKNNILLRYFYSHCRMRVESVDMEDICWYTVVMKAMQMSLELIHVNAIYGHNAHYPELVIFP